MHVSKRALVAVAFAVAFGLGIAYAFRVAAVQGSELVFDSAWWSVLLAPFAGVLAAGLTKR